ncbi:MAG: hypothetical protein ACOX8S_06385 [Christensenellales bacterium]|jgi:hypothetical protein
MENMDNERDILILTDEDDNEIQLEILRFFFYNGEEYAMVTEVDEEAHGGCGGCGGHDHDHDHDHGCGGCGGIEVFFMKVEAVDDENEEYSFVDEALSQELMRVIESELDDEDDEDGEDGEDDEDDEEKDEE